MATSMTTLVRPSPFHAFLAASMVSFASGCVIPLSVGNGYGDESEGSDGGSGEGQDGTGVVDGTTVGASADTVESETSDSAPDEAPEVGPLTLSFSQVKQFDFSWPSTDGADYYQLLESPSPEAPFVQLGADIVGESTSIAMPLHLRHEASYVLRACNMLGCTESDPVSVVGSLAEAVGYFKPSDADSQHGFGYSVALSGDGHTLAVGVGGINIDKAGDVGDAVYVFGRNEMDQWSQQAYIKASNTDVRDWFGENVALSGDGDTLVVGAPQESSSATGIGGEQADDTAAGSGAVYVFVRDGMGEWSQQAYVKASNTDTGDMFGWSVALSGDGNTLVVGASWEGSNATGIGGNQADDSLGGAGAVYVFVRDEMDQWSQQAYVKASNTDAGDLFGRSGVALSRDGNVLTVGAIGEDSSSTGIDGEQGNDHHETGAVYLFVRDAASQWSQHAYFKAATTGCRDNFGRTVALSGDGNTLAVGAEEEGSRGDVICEEAKDETDDGVVYLFVRDGKGQWSQQAYFEYGDKTSHGIGDGIALSGDGNILAVGDTHERGSATGIGRVDEGDVYYAGAAYVFVRAERDQWFLRAYVKASNTGPYDYFGRGVALSEDGNTLAVGAYREASNATGIGGNQADDSEIGRGAVYLY